MSKPIPERHVYTVSDSDKNQMYVFNVFRDIAKREIYIDSIYMIIDHNGITTKVIMNIEHIAKDIWDNPNKQCDRKLNRIINDEFDNLDNQCFGVGVVNDDENKKHVELRSEKLDKLLEELNINAIENLDPIELIDAADRAANSEIDDINKIVEEMMKKNGTRK